MITIKLPLITKCHTILKSITAAAYLKGYDYSQAGLYFITICVQDRECLFGRIVNGVMELNDGRKMAEGKYIEMKTFF